MGPVREDFGIEFFDLFRRQFSVGVQHALVDGHEFRPDHGALSIGVQRYADLFGSRGAGNQVALADDGLALLHQMFEGQTLALDRDPGRAVGLRLEAGLAEVFRQNDSAFRAEFRSPAVVDVQIFLKSRILFDRVGGQVRVFGEVLDARVHAVSLQVFLRLLFAFRIGGVRDHFLAGLQPLFTLFSHLLDLAVFHQDRDEEVEGLDEHQRTAGRHLMSQDHEQDLVRRQHREPRERAGVLERDPAVRALDRALHESFAVFEPQALFDGAVFRGDGDGEIQPSVDGLQIVIVLFDVGELEREILQHHMRDLIRDRPYCFVLVYHFCHNNLP